MAAGGNGDECYGPRRASAVADLAEENMTEENVRYREEDRSMLEERSKGQYWIR